MLAAFIFGHSVLNYFDLKYFLLHVAIRKLEGDAKKKNNFISTMLKQLKFIPGSFATPPNIASAIPLLMSS